MTELIFEGPSRELEIFVEDEVLDKADNHLSLGEIPEHTLIRVGVGKARHLFKSSVVHGDGKQFSSLPPHVFMPASMSSRRILHI